uniref:Uncharacterized protein n=1 Tax=Rhizophora mucronata TaxID=61149 RepID=A0A2P2MU59_RHIMU
MYKNMDDVCGLSFGYALNLLEYYGFEEMPQACPVGVTIQNTMIVTIPTIILMILGYLLSAEFVKGA